jgi:hypothetical protein
MSHVLDFEFCSTTGGGATFAAETNRPNEGAVRESGRSSPGYCDVPFNVKLLSPAFVWIVIVHTSGDGVGASGALYLIVSGSESH